VPVLVRAEMIAIIPARACCGLESERRSVMFDSPSRLVRARYATRYMYVLHDTHVLHVLCVCVCVCVVCVELPSWPRESLIGRSIHGDMSYNDATDVFMS
jgi:hypothetical protein